jgi:hypothetical protein
MEIDAITGVIYVLFASVCTWAAISSWPKIAVRKRCTAAVFVITVLVGASDLFFDSYSLHYLGGLARWGKIEDGRYYVGNHGQYAQVTQGSFQTNLLIDRLLGYVGTGLVIVLLILLLSSGFFRQPGAQWSLESILKPTSAERRGDQKK